MKNDTQKEIGELIEEIVAANASIETYESLTGFSVAIRSGALDCFPVGRAFHGSSIEEALGKCADWVRKAQGKPTREQELAALLEADAAHAAAPQVSFGPDARCGCGSRRPLILERRIKLQVPWLTGYPKLNRIWGLLGIEGIPDRGEIGTCPDCGRNYTFGA